MKFVAFIYCLCMIGATAALIYTAYTLEMTSLAMIKVSNDFRDSYSKAREIEMLARMELGQLSKDGIRIRELLKKLEVKTNGIRSQPEPTRSGRAKGDPGRSDPETTGASKSGARP